MIMISPVCLLGGDLPDGGDAGGDLVDDDAGDGGDVGVVSIFTYDEVHFHRRR